MKTLPIYLLFIFCIHQTSYAQKDYAIMKNDTIYGKIRNAVFGGAVFLTTEDGEIKLKPVNVSGYYRSKHNETYVSRTIPGQEKPVFMYQLAVGKIKLYTHTVSYQSYGNSGSTVTTWYAEKEGSGFNEIKTTGLRGGKGDRKEFFRSLIADNEEVVKKFDASKKFDFKTIEELIKEYNN